MGAAAVQAAVKSGVEEALKAQDAQLPAWALSQAAASKWTVGEVAGDAQKQADLYTRLNWIATAIDHVSDHAAGYEYSVKSRQGEDETDIPNHPFEMLLHDPNPLQSRFEFLRDLYAYYKMTGNGVLWLNRASENEPPAEMWVMPSHLVKPVPDGNLYLKGYVFDTGQGAPIPLETWEVCHIKTFSPLNPFWGLSAVQQLYTIGRGDLAQQAWNTNLFDKENAKIPGALAFHSMIQNADWNRLKSEAADKNLWTEKEYGDFELIVDWRFSRKPEPKKVPLILLSGGYGMNDDGSRKMVEIPDAGDSGREQKPVV